MKIRIEPLALPFLARAAQLTPRTNQFNCTSRRRSENELRMLLDTHEILGVHVSDRFGDYGTGRRADQRDKTSNSLYKYILNGALHHTALDLAVNTASERGLLGIALDPEFTTNHAVYLYWSCIAPPGPDNFTPSQLECADTPELGTDSNNILAVPLLGNRVDRFIWDGTNLTFDHNLIKLRSFQSDGGPVPPGQGDEGQPARGNHDGGVIAFGPDGKLYIFIGDVGRRGHLQNLPCGPTATCPGPTMQDDQFGGPEPDDTHLTGVVLRLNPNGSAPADNPFYAVGADMGGGVGENIQKIFTYGHRNSFGMAEVGFCHGLVEAGGVDRLSLGHPGHRPLRRGEGLPGSRASRSSPRPPSRCRGPQRRGFPESA